jgi:hypothetical protein
MMTMVAASAAAAGPAWAKPYPPPKIHLLCSAPDTAAGSVCVLPFGVTTAPNAYSAAIAVSKVGSVGPTVTFALTAGSLPSGLSMAASGASGTVITGNPTQTGTEPTSSFTVKGIDTQTRPLYQPYQITVDPNQPLTVVLPASGSTLFPGTVGQAFGINFFLSGGAAPYTWALVAGSLPPGMQLRTFSDPRDANNEMAGTPTTAGTFSWTMRVTDFYGHQASQKFTITIQS